MIHNLRIWALGHDTGIELSESEYDSVVTAMHRVYLARDIEEKLDILLENFMEYERDLLSLALQYSLFPMLDDHRVASERQLVNRRITNLLSSARMYVDQMRHSISQLASGSSGPDAAELFSAEYDNHLDVVYDVEPKRDSGVVLWRIDLASEWTRDGWRWKNIS
jgi:hypothetical protein